MKVRHWIIAASAAFALSGCVTYDTLGPQAPGGYYSGRASADYYYGDYGYGYGYPYGYGSYGYTPYYYPYGGYYRSRPRPHYPPPPPHHGNPGGNPGGNRPPRNDNGNDRLPPWRAPARRVDGVEVRPNPGRGSPRQNDGRMPNRPANSQPRPQQYSPQQRPVRPATAPTRPAQAPSNRGSSNGRSAPWRGGGRKD